MMETGEVDVELTCTALMGCVSLDGSDIRASVAASPMCTSSSKPTFFCLAAAARPAAAEGPASSRAGEPISPAAAAAGLPPRQRQACRRPITRLRSALKHTEPSWPCAARATARCLPKLRVWRNSGTL